MSRSGRLVAEAGALTVLIGLMCAGATPDPTDRPEDRALEIELGRIKAHPSPAPLVLGRIEAGIQRLLERYDALEHKARIYFELAELYTFGGMRYPDKVAHYSELALTYPQPVPNAVQLHHAWGAAVEALHRGAPPEEAPAGRKLAGKHYLQALALLDCKMAEVETRRTERPRIQRFPHPQNAEEAAEIEKKVWQSVADLQRRQSEERLILRRPGLVGQIAECFARAPDSRAELREAAKGIIDSEVVLQELTSALAAATTQPSVATQPSRTVQ